jgi:hypothetical protein
MTKYSQDKDEKLQQFRISIDRAWDILDVEFPDKQKLVDELLTGINSQRPVNRDSKSLSQYASLITGYINDMEDNQCLVSSSSEVQFFMSQLLLKLSPGDNSAFGRDMKKDKRRKMFPTLLFSCKKRQVFVQEEEITLKTKMLAEDPTTDLETLK